MSDLFEFDVELTEIQLVSALPNLMRVPLAVEAVIDHVFLCRRDCACVWLVKATLHTLIFKMCLL